MVHICLKDALYVGLSVGLFVGSSLCRSSVSQIQRKLARLALKICNWHSSTHSYSFIVAYTRLYKSLFLSVRPLVTLLKFLPESYLNRNNAPAHPFVTDAVVYTTLFQSFIHSFIDLAHRCLAQRHILFDTRIEANWCRLMRVDKMDAKMDAEIDATTALMTIALSSTSGSGSSASTSTITY